MGKKVAQQDVAAASVFVRPGFEAGTFIGVETKKVLVETEPFKGENGAWVITGMVAESRMTVTFFGQTAAQLPKLEAGKVYMIEADWVQGTRKTRNGAMVPVLRAKRVIGKPVLAEDQSRADFSMIKGNDDVREFSPRNLIPQDVAEAAGLADM